MHEKDKVSYTEWLAYSEALVWVTYVGGGGVAYRHEVSFPEPSEQMINLFLCEWSICLVA